VGGNDADEFVGTRLSSHPETARTIGDLAGSEEIQSAHLAEALHASQLPEDDVRIK